MNLFPHIAKRNPMVLFVILYKNFWDDSTESDNQTEYSADETMRCIF